MITRETTHGATSHSLLHGASCGLLLFLLVPAVERALDRLVFPLTEPGIALLAVAALAIPALPLPPRRGRPVAAIAAVLAASAAALYPTPPTDLLALAAAALWLGLAPRYLSRRAVTAGVATGFAALPLAFAVRPGSAYALALGAVAGALALAAFAWPELRSASPERRGRGFRLRGLLAFGALLYLDAVLRQLSAAGPGATALLAATGLLAALPLWLAPVPLPGRRRELLLLAALATASTVVAYAGFAPIFTAAAARVMLVVLVGRALVPAGGRRPRIHASAAWAAWAAAAAVAGYFGVVVGLGFASALALIAFALLPRPAAWRELEPS